MILRILVWLFILHIYGLLRVLGCYCSSYWLSWLMLSLSEVQRLCLCKITHFWVNYFRIWSILNTLSLSSESRPHANFRATTILISLISPWLFLAKSWWCWTSQFARIRPWYHWFIMWLLPFYVCTFLRWNLTLCNITLLLLDRMGSMRHWISVRIYAWRWLVMLLRHHIIKI